MTTVLSQIKTKKTLDQFAADLDYLENALYKTDTSFDDYLGKSVDVNLADALRKAFSSANKKTVIDEYKKEIEEARVVKVVISIPETSEIVDKVSSFVKTAISDAAVVDLRVNKLILAGAVVEYDGRILDNSLNAIFVQKRTKLDKIIKNTMSSRP